MEAPWYLILVNRDNPVPEDYELRLTELDNGESVNKLIYPDLQKMFDDMRAEGVYPVVCSGYRTR
jgi:D-alanyl-D-alanine carboxypeptidase